MQYVAAFDPKTPTPPVEWARQREAEGWYGIALPDHIALGGFGWWHPFATVGAIAATTDRLLLTHAFSNNLMRSPAELAQAALSLQALSNGRFEIGLGAGWAKEELVRIGLQFPAAKERAERFHEAASILRDLMNGSCRHTGTHYTIDVDAVGPPTDSAPPIAAALGGPWTIRNIAPLLDRIEIHPLGSTMRDGQMDPTGTASITDDTVREMIANARAANPKAAIGLSVVAAAGNSPAIGQMAAGFGDGFAKGLAGQPEQVAETLRAIPERFDVDRVTLVLPVPETAGLIAPLLF